MPKKNAAKKNRSKESITKSPKKEKITEEKKTATSNEEVIEETVQEASPKKKDNSPKEEIEKEHLDKKFEEEKLSDDSLEKSIDDNDEEEEKKNRVINIVKKIFLIITSPIWFPWKVLFVKKKGNKYRDVSTSKKIFRVLRAPITKTLKFLAYICVIGLEIFVVYKVRYSVLTYPLTKNAVQSHYLSAAGASEEYQKSLKEAFALIDDWDLNTKNKMYVIFDSDIVKTTFEYASESTRQYIVDKFAEDEDFREDIRYTAENIDNILSRAIKEIPDALNSEEIGKTLDPITTVGANALDYRAALDILGTVSDAFLIEEDIATGSIDIPREEIDQSIEILTKYARGMSIEEAYYSQEDTKKN